MKILLIEDEEKVANFLQTALEEEDFEVEIAMDGNTGFELAQANDYSVILLDLMLPGRDGFSILRELRELKIFTPVLILTARSEIKDKVEGFEIGADDYLSKPFSFEELTARIKALIRRSDPELSTVIRFEDLELDTVAHVARRNNEVIELTIKEYELLEFLMRNKNTPITREEITKKVWKQNYQNDSNIIDVYIKRLRSKIGPSSDNQNLIKSIRGMGYVIGKVE